VSPEGLLARGWHDLLAGLSGQGRYLVPLLFAAAALWQAQPERLPDRLRQPSASAGLTLSLLTLLGLVQGLSADPHPDWQGSGGGLIGWLVYRGLVVLVGPTGALSLLGAGLLGGLLLTSGLSPAAGRAAMVRLAAWWRQRRAGRPVVVVPTTPARPHLRLGLPQLRRPSDATPPPAAPAAPEPAPPPPPPRKAGRWQLPPVTLLATGQGGELSTAEIERKIRLIEETLSDFDVPAKVVEVNAGPTVTQFGLRPGFREKRDKHGAVIRRERVKVSEITALANDLALALAAPSIRIEAPVPGRPLVGIELPNATAGLVTLRQLIETPAFQRLRARTKLALALGQDVSGQAVVADLARMPHLLIAGATGSGKSVCINALVTCLLLHTTPAELRLLMIDPKRVELTTYNGIPHLLRDVVVEVDKVVGVLRWVTREMDERYRRFEQVGMRNIDAYNRLMASRNEPPLPYLVVIIDELADIMLAAAEEVEPALCRLAQMARATGIHLIVATQRPSVDVITGLIKANFPTRISFAVTSQVDSRTILDMAGAERLLGRGDMLYLAADAPKPVRLQGAFVSDAEIEAVTTFWRAQGAPQYVPELVNVTTDQEDQEDDLLAQAAEIARQHQRVSISLLQRRLRIGYNRAARLLEQLTERGIIEPAGEDRARDVLLKSEAATEGGNPDGDRHQP
jgi:S-DNA-T family DNA segregation ATPase FtsK/SpoIIIE